MKLRSQLLVVAAVVIVLPLAGWQFVKSLEQSLRAAHERTLVDSATAIARSVREAGHGNWPNARDAVYVHHIDGDIHLDGHDGEWAPWLDQRQMLAKGNEEVGAVAVRNRSGLYLLLHVVDDNLIFADRESGAGDRAEIDLAAGTKTDTVSVQPYAPGWLEATGRNGVFRIRGNWQPRRDGWTLEAQVAGNQPPDRIGITVVDVDDPHGRTSHVQASTSRLLPLIGRDADLDRHLSERLPDHSRAWITTARGWVVGHADRSVSSTRERSSGSSTLVFESLLGDRLPERPARDAFTARIGRESNPSTPSATWVASDEGFGMTVVANAPIRNESDVIGHVVLERDADEFLVQANEAVIKLFASGIAGVGLIAFILIGFAAVISERIRRLHHSAERAVEPDGRVRETLTPPSARDEIGDLGRSLADLIDRQQAHQDYLRTLADKLAHELRTPIAMVRSSLDNLAEAENESEARRYRERASEGCQRLSRILQSMSQAARVEESLSNEPRVRLDLAELLENYVAGCRSTYPEHRFRLQAPRDKAVWINASADLIAQLLDKLIENAVDFTPEGECIRLRLAWREGHAIVQVDNPGPPLPERLAGRLFESMVSERKSGGEGVHLGLGLHVARLIAEYHGGSIHAANRPGGCRFEVTLPEARPPDAQEPP